PRWEEESRKEVCEDCVEIEIIPFENRADGGCDDDAPLLRRVDTAVDPSNRGCFHGTTHPVLPKLARQIRRRPCDFSVRRSWKKRSRGATLRGPTNVCQAGGLQSDALRLECVRRRGLIFANDRG